MLRERIHLVGNVGAVIRFPSGGQDERIAQQQSQVRVAVCFVDDVGEQDHRANVAQICEIVRLRITYPNVFALQAVQESRRFNALQRASVQLEELANEFVNAAPPHFHFTIHALVQQAIDAVQFFANVVRRRILCQVGDDPRLRQVERQRDSGGTEQG